MEKVEDFGLKLVLGSAGEGVRQSAGNAGDSQGKYLKQRYLFRNYLRRLLKMRMLNSPRKRAEAAKRRGSCI